MLAKIPMGWQTLRTFCLMILALFLGVGVRAEERMREPSEYEIKAALLYGVINFVEWPEQTFRDDQDPLTLCLIVSQEEHGSFENLPPVTAHGRPLGRVFFDAVPRIDDLAPCRALFIQREFHNLGSPMLRLLRGRPILTIDDWAGDGMIGFLVRNSRIRFVIDLREVGQAGLKVSSQLLRLAVSVKE